MANLKVIYIGLPNRVRVSKCVREQSRRKSVLLRSGNERGKVVLVAAAKAYPWAEEKESMGWLCIEQGPRLAGERVRAQGRITHRHSDSGREDQGRWEGKDDSQALCGFSFPSEDGYDVISEIVGRVLGIKMI